MAQSRFSSNTPDWEDSAIHIVAMESINNVAVVVEMTVVDRRGRGDVVLCLRAYQRDVEKSEATLLASASVSTLGSGMASLEGALIHGLYQLDAALAQGEFEKTIKRQ